MNIVEFDRLLSESGIRIPKDTKAAKIIHHQDLDGVFSAIIVYNQLVKQGIDPKHIVTQWVQYGDTKEGYLSKLKKSKGQMVALVDFANIPEGETKPDFWSDHHQREKQYGTSGGRTGATEFKSEAAHLALLHTDNMVDSTTLNIIDKIDSAEYTSIEDILTLRKDFKEKGRMERLGIICNALLSKSGILNDNSLLESFIKSTKPSLVSFYTNILEYVRLNEIQEEAIRELKKENPNWEMIEKARTLMPTQKAKERIMKGASFNESAISDYEELQTLSRKKRTEEEEKRYKELINAPIEKMRKARIDSLVKEKSKEGGFEKRGSTLIQKNTQLQRYLWTQLNTAGIKYPFVVKRYATFLQVSVNPDLPSDVREYIDLGAVAKDVMQKVRNKFENKYNSWAFDIIETESGGHKGVTNISALGTLGIMKKTDREELKFLESLESRINRLQSIHKEMSDEDKKRLEQAKQMLANKKIEEVDYNKLEKLLSSKMNILMPQKFKRLLELKTKKKVFAEKRTKIMDEIIDEFINQFEERFGASKSEPKMGKEKEIKLTGGKKEYEFESIIDVLRREILR